MFKLDISEQPITKRGILSIINLGFLAHVVLEGKLILCELMSTKIDWDDRISEGISRKWEN